MKKGIHPNHMACTVTCGCGESFLTRAAVPELKVEICSKCHPFYTGRQKLVDTAGRVEKFRRRYASVLDQKKEAQASETESPPS